MIVKFKQTTAIGLIIGLLAVTPISFAYESDSDFKAAPKPYLAQEDIDDPEAVEGDFEERVRVMQEWLRRREAERRHQDWGFDVVSPQESPVARPSSSNYFEEHGYDERGFRRLDGNVRVKLRGVQDDSEQQTPQGGWDSSAGQLDATRKPFKSSDHAPRLSRANKTSGRARGKVSSRHR